MPEPISMTNLLLSAGSNLLGGFLGNNALSETKDQITDMSQYNPMGFSGPGGSLNFNGNQGFFSQDQLGAALRQQLGSAGVGALGQQGMLQNPAFQSAFQGLDIASPFGQQQQALTGAAPQFFNQGAFQQNAQNVNQLGNIFANRAAGGPTDLTGGFQQGLLGQGMNTLQGAGNVGGLIQQNLDASRALAQPFEDRARNAFMDREFQMTRGATQGSGNRAFDFNANLMNADQQRIMNAQQLGLQQSGQMQQLGMGQLNAGQGLLGLNLQNFGQNLQGADQFARLGMGAEAQGLQQLIQSQNLGLNRGQQRLTNALNLFGMAPGLRESDMNVALGATEGMNMFDQLAQQGFLGALNAESGRIGAQGAHAQALSQLGQGQGGLMGGIFSGIGSLFG